MKVYAYGTLVPDSFLSELLADGWTEDDLTTENIERLLFYEHLDSM